MENPAETFVPKVISDLVARLKEATGHDGRIERLDVRTWRMTTESDRVRVTVDFDIKANGKVRRKGSTLAIGGVPQPLAQGFEDLVRIFKEEDSGQDPAPVVAGEEKPPVIEPMPPARPIEDAPSIVQAAYQAMTRTGKLPVEVGEDENGRWVIGVETDTRVLRLGYARVRKQWGIGGLQVIVDGVDRSREAGGDISKALALLLGPGAAPEAEKRIGSPSRSARSIAVETRRATVIRN